MTLQYTPDELRKEAQKAQDSLQPLLAAKFYTRIFEQEQSYEIAQQLANCYFEALQTDPNQYDQVMQWSLKSLELNKDQWESYLLLGQLSEGKEAVELYKRGLANLSPKLEQNQDHLQCYSDALCALAEIYMTDLCDEEDAESNCVAFMEEALKRHPQNPEIYSTFASVRLSQCRNQEAKELLEKGMDLWYVEPEEDSAVVVDASWPLFPSRMTLVRLLVEVGSYERALAVLETCEAENDEDVEVWYLYGWSYVKLAESVPQDSAMNLADAKECLLQVLQLNERFRQMEEPLVPDEILDHTREMLEQINSFSAMDMS